MLLTVIFLSYSKLPRALRPHFPTHLHFFSNAVIFLFFLLFSFFLQMTEPCIDVCFAQGLTWQKRSGAWRQLFSCRDVGRSELKAKISWVLRRAREDGDLKMTSSILSSCGCLNSCLQKILFWNQNGNPDEALKSKTEIISEHQCTMERKSKENKILE